MKNGEHYKVAFSNNTNVGTAKATFTGIGNYTGTVTKTFKINCKTPDIPSAANVNGGIKISWKKVPGAAKYRVFKKVGKGKWTKVGDTTALNLTDKDKKLKSGTAYVYTVRCISKDGKTFTSAFNTTGRKIVYVARPAAGKLTSPGAKQMTVRWKKVSAASGYQIQYSQNKKFAKGNKLVTVAGGSKTSRLVKKLASKKTYYVRVRAYKTVGGKKYYSAWSAVKKVKVK